MKILKTSLTTLVVAAAMTATQAFAGMMTQTPMPAPCQESEYFNGLYVGVGAGLAKPNAKAEYDYKFDDDALVMGAKSEDSGKYGFGASIFAGFGKVFDSTTYLGAEIFGNYFEPDMTLSSFFTVLEGEEIKNKTKIENDYSFGILARAGYLFSPKTMFYVLFGIEESEFDMKSTTNAVFYDDPTADELISISDKFNKHKTGYLPGIGMETVIADQVTLKIQYVYSFYSSFKRTTQETVTVITDPGKPPTTEEVTKTDVTKIDPSRGYLSLMLSWYVG